ncbi:MULTISPECIES: hypothetical protein [unclassified Thermoactinomyces]|jgi:tetratricopeptide (TPR) repeat protein|uniref:hypothetical protein n=1 Tax=Thermoactinomyces TaxID=2023 RepID=UPI0018DD2DCF|nr:MULTISPECIES: hypothetical protein [unclassified Thermoactinomyces]MBH8582720.1 hypothetical protein [Thermoactinomyces sp. CICC 10735]MBH8601153.1 hypothetical protein [Thermoactinomyces sp. CICC 23799]
MDYISQDLRKRIGEYLRNVRKSKNIPMKQVTEEGLSEPTICRIEKGVGDTPIEKIRILANKLGINLDKEFGLNQRELAIIKAKLLHIEYKAELKLNLEVCLQELDEINLPDSHPLHFLWIHLKGKTLFYMGKADQAEQFTLRILNLNRTIEMKKSNIISCAKNILSNIYYLKRDLHRALNEINGAIELFDPNGERAEKIHMFLINKSVYLKHLDRDTESDEIVEYLYKNIDQIFDPRVKVTVHELMARIHLKNKKYNEAIQCCMDGLYLSSTMNLIDRCVELWSVLGSIYEEMSMYGEALIQYQTALSYKGTTQPYLFITVYSMLAGLYERIGDLKKCENAHNKALEYHDDSIRYIDALINKAFFLKRHERSNEAGNHLEQARILARQQKLWTKAHDIVHELTQIYKGSNRDKYHQYLEELQEIIGLLKERGFKYVG